MHELAIAESIINTVVDESKKNGCKAVTKIVVRVGALTDIVPEALQFGFEVASAETVISGAKLEIESVPVKGNCNNCSINFELHEHIFVCPECESFDIKMTQGDELDIAYIEIEETDDTVA